MKKTDKRKVFPVVIALVIVLALGVTTGCGGCFGLGMLGCIGGCVRNIIKIETETETHSGGIEIPTGSPETRPSEKESETQKPSGGDDQTQGDVFELTYTEYDPTGFNAMCDELSALAKGTDPAAVISKYDEILQEFKHIDENSTMLYIQYSCNPSDEYLNDQYQKDSSQETALLDKALTAINEVCEGPCADAFKAHVGEVDFEEFDSYEAMTEEEIAIDDRITALVAEYYADIEKAEDTGMDDDELNSLVAPIYLELVSLRNKYAQLNGYDTYVEYADELVYNRDFDESEIEAFHDAVKHMSARAYDLMYYSSAYSAPYYIDFDMSVDDLLDALTTFGAQISPLAEESGRLLLDRKLYNIGSDNTRMSGAYTATMEETGVPYIFASSEGANGFVTMTHEFGHFTEATINHNPNLLLYGLGALELCEIHSNGLEALYSRYYDDIYGAYANEMRAYVVIDLLSNVTEGCLFDEFQRAVYRNPDMTVDELNTLYRDICNEYGSPSGADDYWWMYVSHNFESPMYYLSYAASGIVALQIWSQSQIDYDKAVEMWESIVNAGAYDYGYMELLDDLEISTFDDTATVAVICDQALNFVEANSTYYGGGNYEGGSEFPDFNFPEGGDWSDWFNDWIDQFGGLFD